MRHGGNALLRPLPRGRLRPGKDTFAVAIDSVGTGDVRFVVSEGMTISLDMDKRLVELCQAVADADREDANEFRAAPIRHGFATDALAARARGMRATAITCLEPGAITPARYHTPDDVPGAIDAAALGRAEGFCMSLIRALDRDQGRSASRPKPEPEPQRRTRRRAKAA